MTYHARNADDLLPPWLARTIVVILIVAIVVPLGYMVLLSVTPNQNVALGTISLAALDLSNYAKMWSQAPLFSGLWHTVVIAGLAALISVIVAVLAAYPLTRFQFLGRKPFLATLIAVQTVPGTTLLLPLFAVFSWIQTTLSVTFIGSFWLVILVYMTFGIPLSTWLIFSYMQTIPHELEEAGLVDGCSRLGALLRIVVPLTRPAMVVAFVFAFLVGWNDVLFASVFTHANSQTLAIVVQRFSALQASSSLPLYGELMAAAVVSSAPVIILYLIFQRHLTTGLSAGAMGGT